MRTCRLASARRGFTLAEVAVTIVIVGIGMLLVLQGLNTAKMAAAQTRNLKLSRELALITLGQIASGQFQDEIQKGLQGSYAEEGYPDFAYDVVVGDDTFSDEQAAAARASGDAYNKALADSGYGEITTEIAPAGTFYYAEDYHQQYLAKNPYGYCGLGGTGVTCS